MSRRPEPKEPKWKQSVSRYYADALKQFSDSFYDPDTITISPRFFHFSLSYFNNFFLNK